MNYKEYDDETLKKLHEVELGILEEIVRICKKHNLDYFLMGGSMIGAVRHQGFIPWDDDIDIGMTRHDYNLFLEYAQKELNSQYFLDCFEINEDYYLPFAKVKKNGTIFDEDSSHHLKNHKGIFVDIFPYDNASKEDSLKQKIQAILVKNMTETMFYKNRIRPLKKTRHPFLVFLLSILPKKKIMRIQKKLMCLNKNDQSEYLVTLAGAYGYQKETNKRSVFLPSKTYKFDGHEYQGMNDSHSYLTKLYGNYMQLPPKEKRFNHMPLEINFGKKSNY